jgi:hypothetical protein
MCLTVCLMLLTTGLGRAGEAAGFTADALYAGDLKGGLTRLEPLAATDQEAKFGAGLLRFVSAIEGFAQGLYRHGFTAPDGGPMMGRPLALPVPANPSPEPLTYEKFRAILQQLVDGLDAARPALLEAGASGDYVVPVEPLKIRIDIDGDGQATEAESIGTILSFLQGMPTVAAPAGEPLPAPPTPQLTIGLDRADAFWLAGYTEVLAAQADFLLAHDFRRLLESTFHRVFPRAGLPMQGYTTSTGTLMLDPQSDNAIADALALIHELSWDVTEPERLLRVQTRLKDVLALSRRNWEAILAETDDNRELLPSPRQTGPNPDAKITEAQVDAWLATLDKAGEVLDGKLLIPHWRYRQGFDLDAWFHTARRTDMVMLITGFDALPYLKDGPIASADSFRQLTAAFGDAWLGYSFWFN